jgi:hypothetical protein
LIKAVALQKEVKLPQAANNNSSEHDILPIFKSVLGNPEIYRPVVLYGKQFFNVSFLC